MHLSFTAPHRKSRLRLSAKSASQPAVFFSKKKPASSTFSQPDQPKQIGRCEASSAVRYFYSGRGWMDAWIDRVVACGSFFIGGSKNLILTYIYINFLR
jgi:hypothetical protein